MLSLSISTNEGPPQQNPRGYVEVGEKGTSVIAKCLRMYNLREVQYMVGHRYVSSKEKYLQNDMEELKEEVQQFHPLR